MGHISTSRPSRLNIAYGCDGKRTLKIFLHQDGDQDSSPKSDCLNLSYILTSFVFNFEILAVC